MDSYLSCGVAGVPQGIPQMLSRAGGGVDHFDGQARVALSSGGGVGPVGLCDLFPHHRVEARTGLVAKDKSGVVVVSVGVDVKCSAEVHGAELVIT